MKNRYDDETSYLTWVKPALPETPWSIGALRLPDERAKLAHDLRRIFQRVLLTVFALAGLACATARAQTPTARWPSWATEAASGAALDLAVRGPWVNPSWRRRFAVRMATAGAASALYERFVDWNGWSWKDVGERAAGTVAADLAWTAGKRLVEGDPRAALQVVGTGLVLIDVQSTVAALRYSTVREMNPLLGPRPSTARLVVTAGLGAIAYDWAVQKAPRPAAIALGLAMIAVESRVVWSNQRSARAARAIAER